MIVADIACPLGMERLVPTNLPLSAEERAQFVGIYDLGPIQLRVFEDGERLLLQPSGQATALPERAPVVPE